MNDLIPTIKKHAHALKGSPDDFDTLLESIGDARAIEPLERTAEWERGEFPETYPSGM